MIQTSFKKLLFYQQCDKSGKENCKFQFIDNIMSITVQAQGENFTTGKEFPSNSLNEK